MCLVREIWKILEKSGYWGSIFLRFRVVTISNWYITELQIRGGIEDNSKISFLISQ